MRCGIYQIKNNISGKKYIGQSSDLKGRKKEHRYKLKNNKHENPHLQKAFYKYGMDAFTFSVLLYCDPFNLSFYEQLCVDNLKPEYNILTECVESSLGYKHTEEAKRKMKEAQNRITREGKRRGGGGGRLPGFVVSEETKQKISKAHKGKIVSEETRKKMSEVRTGIRPYIITEETRKKMSEAKKNISDETRNKMSESQKKRKRVPVSDETREKMSKAKKGKQAYQITDEIREKMSKAQRLRFQTTPVSDETKEKLSKASKAYQQKLEEKT